VLMVVVSKFTSKPDEKTLARYFTQAVGVMTEVETGV
jgi:hypothetical protein